VILNPENVGFSEGCNIGIRESDGEYTVLLNPDTNVPEGWLARMREYFADDSVGAVGPMSNYVAGVQQYGFHFLAGMAGSITAQEIQTLAQSINTRRSVESKLLIGFCMMLRRSVLDQVGLLDSELFLGCDDLDMSWRLRLAVYRLLVATDVFVLHKGHVSFDTEPQTKTDALVQKSTDVLARKLQKHYGEGNVPSPAEIWGIDWFTPSPDALETSS
jgi:GT2 family glycosyltransferase